MADMSRGWYGDREALGCGDEERSHAALVTAPKAQVQESFRRQSDGENGILVTREFTTECVRSG